MGRKPKRIGHFHTNVAGVTYDNRQALLPHLHRYEQLILDHDETNKHDSNAVKILTANGSQIGFLHREEAAEVVGHIAEGRLYSCFVNDVTGGTSDKPTLGCNLLLVWAFPDTTQEEQEAYCESIGLPVVRKTSTPQMEPIVNPPRVISTSGMKIYTASKPDGSLVAAVLGFFKNVFKK